MEYYHIYYRNKGISYGWYVLLEQEEIGPFSCRDDVIEFLKEKDAS